jgi:hypothetical protein
VHDSTGEDEAWKKSIHNGYYMFDYEKALREHSNLSRYLNVHALEEAGIHIPYRHFRVDETYVERQSEILDIDVELHASMKENVPYPITHRMSVYDRGSTKDNTPDPNEAPIYRTAISCTFLEGTWSHLMNRRFVDVSVNSIETESGIQDYRLLAFELIDFTDGNDTDGIDVFGSTSGNSTGGSDSNTISTICSYTATVSIEDKTMQFFGALEDMLRSINGQYHSYLRRCEQLCAANNTTNLFNAFFSESIMQEYEDNMNMAPWIRCPLFLLSIQHIITGQWRDRQEIIERAAIIVSQINPVNGNLAAVQAFSEDLQELKDGLLEKIKEEARIPLPEDADWYDIETIHDYSCNLPITDNNSYNDGNGLYPMETECDEQPAGEFSADPAADDPAASSPSGPADAPASVNDFEPDGEVAEGRIPVGEELLDGLAGDALPDQGDEDAVTGMPGRDVEISS